MISFLKLIYKHKEPVSFAIGLVGLVFGLIQYFFPYDHETSLKFFLKDEINVVSISQNVEKLSIYFNNRDIKRDSLNLRIFKVKLKNNGSKSISENDFASIPFGLRVRGGSLVFVKHQGSNDYLSKNIKPMIIDSTEINFNKCVFDKGDFVDLEILVIHKINKNPEIISIGKIAGLEKIHIEKGNGDDENSLLYGILTIFVSTGILVAFGIFLFGIAWSIDSTKKFFRKRSILAFFDYPIAILTKEQKVIVDIVSKLGFKSFSAFILEIEKVSGSYFEIYINEAKNKETISNFKSLVKDKKYHVSKSESDLKEYKSDFLDIIEKLEGANLSNEADKTVDSRFLLEAKRVVLNY